ncbi:MAG TPA: hypothetical protein DEE98_07285 [Elusimicrobia bacterium]|nr:MAG: hypothetical protein A2278_00080 [Elusimicrobia bacterium RIFOXYA12_FULL_49_49]OGS11455.1 MAG: hypothetical protein A2386_00010 [Elusimicrobia bacterium RIFOXYB1_FULL_48_9]OGS15834.1 MAG: hypothetical protein A2251_04215 [Elusimicrobia bacterium RIFOXYA2_FULL_47_53]OGS27128.1 MAG: hypothetical protein A2339_00465 [Elusimicrobia bacterium RIFOXYB12_FULL_50_12]OGS31166.1 MAG: hypothetical protein A2323_08935 [Elusimicrobia bacterium RIFOXYB2_FULL_46_23]HBU70168.1 hypothetical protein [El
MGFFSQDEVKRKLFHFLILLYIAAYWFLPRILVLQAMGILIFAIAVTEALRLNNSRLNKWILNVLGGVHRKEEETQISGLLWTFSGSFFTMLIFQDKNIVTASLLYLAFGDAVAALVGRRHGKNKILNEKTIEGSIACFAVCFGIGMFFLDWPLAFWGALVATSIEVMPWPLNDNFWMPLTSAMVLTSFAKAFLS